MKLRSLNLPLGPEGGGGGT